MRCEKCDQLELELLKVALKNEWAKRIYYRLFWETFSKKHKRLFMHSSMCDLCGLDIANTFKPCEKKPKEPIFRMIRL